MKYTLYLSVAGFINFLTVFLPIYGCTEFRVIAQDNSVVIGRSMEWGDDMHSRINVQPRGQKRISRAPNGTNGLQWKSRYGFVYIDGYGIDGATDGMNEKGLSVGILFFPGFSKFEKVPADRQERALSYLDFVFWVLGNFETVDQVRQTLKHVYVWETSLDIPNQKNAVFPVHFSVYDQKGNGIVIEYTKEGLKIFDNEIGVLTNSPTFDWHMTNLRNYVGLSSLQVNPIKIGNLSFKEIGQGTGLRGLPGDPTPPSRFVRTAIMVNLADPANTAQDALVLANHVLNTVDIPLGTIKDIKNNITQKDYPQWVVIKDLTNKALYFRTYKNSTLRKIDLKKLDFSPLAKKTALAIEEGAPSFVDVTERFIPGNAKKSSNKS